MKIRTELCLEIGHRDYLFFAYIDLFCWNITIGRGPWYYHIGIGPLGIGWKHYPGAGQKH